MTDAAERDGSTSGDDARNRQPGSCLGDDAEDSDSSDESELCSASFQVRDDISNAVATTTLHAESVVNDRHSTNALEQNGDC